jgi:energy-coupling factor transporter ATP-binding protein EcfA2
MPGRIQDRLRRAEESSFVGRAKECELFEDLLNADLPKHAVLFVYGPGGVGKTSLLGAFAGQCATAGVRVARIDSRRFSDRTGFLDTLAEAVTAPDSGRALEMLAANRYALLIDTFEEASSLEGWLVGDFLPNLPESVVVVLAGRRAPSDEWNRVPGWATLMRPIPLRNLSKEESEDLLIRAGVPLDRVPGWFATTFGHPLALSLSADLYLQKPDDSGIPTKSPDVVRALLERFVMKVPSPAHRVALEACALSRVMTEPLLRATLETPDAEQLFAWLRDRSFIEAGPEGLLTHDMARDVLASDLRWRNPSLYRTLHRRARLYFVERAKEARQGSDQRRYLKEMVYLHRDNPIIRPIFERTRSEMKRPVAVEEPFVFDRDAEEVRAIVSRHEGRESAELALRWARQQPAGARVFREDRKVVGLFISVFLEQASDRDIQADPGASAAMDHLQQESPMRPGERSTLFRFWMAKEGYQSLSPVQLAAFIHMVQHYILTPGLAFTFLVCGRPEELQSLLAYGDVLRIPGADFEVGDRRFGVFGHDWRVRTPDAWLELMGRRQAGAEPEVETGGRQTDVVVLSEDGFRSAVKDALRCFSRPDRMSDNPLLRSSLVLSEDGSDRAQVLLSLVRRAAGPLSESARTETSFRALDRTYFRPAGSQEAASELIGVPYSTFRRHLARAIDEVVATLWRWELDGVPAGG